MIFSISDLDTEDFINLVGQYNHLRLGGKAEVDPQLAARGYSPEILAMTSKRAAEEFRPIVSCGLRFTKHMGAFKYPYFGYVLQLFENYERGLLPFDGPVSEQPAQIMEIFSVLQTMKLEQEKKNIEKKKPRGRQQR